MKRRLFFLIIGMLAMSLTACGSDENKNEMKPDVITEENLEYYAYESGSSSLCERFAVYEYHGEFIFAADYFNCGKELLENRQLSEEESEAFLEEINAVSAEDAEEIEDGDGAYMEEGILAADGIHYSVGLIDFAAMGIEVTSAYDVSYSSEEESEKYELEGILELQELTQWKERIVFSGAKEFARSVAKQIEELSGEEIDKMVIDSFLDEDFIIKAEMQNGDSYRVTVTYSGYVAEAEKE